MRSSFLDNAKFVLISLVLLGHQLELVLGSGALVHSAYLFLYAFHVPALALVSGAVATTDWRGKDSKRLLLGLVVPYLLLQVLYKICEQSFWQVHVGQTFDLLTPYWLLWYLMSLGFWRLMLPVFAVLRLPLVAAIFLALGAGLMNDVGYTLSLGRTFVFFPFFVLGHQLRQHPMAKQAATRRWQAAAALVLCGIFVLAWLNQGLDAKWLYGGWSYQTFPMAPWEAVLCRAALLAVATCGALATLILVPKRRLWMTRFGEHSLYCYVLHGFIVRTVSARGLLGGLTLSQPAWIAAAVVTAVVMNVVLSSPQVAVLLAPALNPSWLGRWLFSAELKSAGHPFELPSGP